MALLGLDHVNIRSADVPRLVRFYRDCLGLAPGDRPPFSFDGAWLYCNAQPVVHLVAVERTPDPGPPRLEHFAFAATGLLDFLGHLRRQRVPYRVTEVPGRGVRQVNLSDPDGNHLHVDFPPGEEPDLWAFSP